MNNKNIFDEGKETLIPFLEIHFGMHLVLYKKCITKMLEKSSDAHKNIYKKWLLPMCPKLKGKLVLVVKNTL